jgi:predicted homoserine dehydrogenase-like protein
MNKINLTKADNIVNSINNEKSNVKRIKNENGLIERIESDKVVLTEDNKMLLKD